VSCVTVALPVDSSIVVLQSVTGWCTLLQPCSGLNAKVTLIACILQDALL
jgi:hypothetical protein